MQEANRSARLACLRGRRSLLRSMPTTWIREARFSVDVRDGNYRKNVSSKLSVSIR